MGDQTSVSRPAATREPPSGWTVAFSNRATAKDIFYCFRLLLGRYPHPEEWRGHAMRAGEDLKGVVTSFAGSLECAQQALFRPADPSPPFAADFGGLRIYTALDDAAIGQAVRSGSYEPEIVGLFRQILRPGMGVLDLGANIGFFSLLASHLVGPGGAVFAVEPNRLNVRLLEASRRANGFSQLTIYQMAAAATNGLLVLNTSYSNGTTSTLPTDIATLLTAETVPAFRMDALLPATTPIDLIKIDVEGAEYTAMLGCVDTIRRNSPVIISEFSPGLMPGISGIDGPGYLNWLIGLGYLISVIQPDGAVQCAGRDVDLVMRAYSARGSDHIDILARHESRP
jgi:FkbM family methyltransferase